jgi:inhibitor of KinA
MQPIITPLGDSALTITFGAAINEQINQTVLSFFHYLKRINVSGVIDIIPAYASLTIVYDLIKIREQFKNSSAYDYMHTQVLNALKDSTFSKVNKSRTMEIPVCYDVSLGTDLYSMANEKGLSIEEIIKIHSTKTYRVYMIGFLPGFAYMGEVDNKIATPRKAVPAQNILAGSVGIADSQTGIYPFNSPGGWNIIGQTPLQLFNSTKQQPCLIQPGDKIIFEPISLSEFQHLKQS